MPGYEPMISSEWQYPKDNDSASKFRKQPTTLRHLRITSQQKHSSHNMAICVDNLMRSPLQSCNCQRSHASIARYRKRYPTHDIEATACLKTVLGRNGFLNSRQRGAEIGGSINGDQTGQDGRCHGRTGWDKVDGQQAWRREAPSVGSG